MQFACNLFSSLLLSRQCLPLRDKPDRVFMRFKLAGARSLSEKRRHPGYTAWRKKADQRASSSRQCALRISPEARKTGVAGRCCLTQAFSAKPSMLPVFFGNRNGPPRTARHNPARSRSPGWALALESRCRPANHFTEPVRLLIASASSR
jgi:hypothetical protein